MYDILYIGLKETYNQRSNRWKIQRQSSFGVKNAK